MSRHNRHGRRHRTQPQHGIATATACADCAHLIGNPEPLNGDMQPDPGGIHMGLLHEHHIPELQALGWVLTEDEYGKCITCEHFHRDNWIGDPI